MQATSFGLVLAVTMFGCGSAGTTTGSGSGGPSAGGASSGDGGAGSLPDGGTAIPIKRTLHVRVGGNGHVQRAATDCRFDCQQQFDDGQTVHLVAIPGAQFRFDGWLGDCSGAGACDLTMSADRSVLARFSLAATIIVAPTGTGSGRVTSLPSGIDCPGSCTITVPIETPMTLTAYPDASSVFVGWGGACSGDTVCKLGAYGDQTLWANFETKAPPPVSTCTGIGPPETPPVMQYVHYPWDGIGFACGDATADASGTLALVVNGGHADGIDFVSSSGTRLRQGGASMFGFLLNQPTGFSHASGRPYLGPEHGQMISDFDAAGHSTGVSYLTNHSGQKNIPASADPNGGVLFAGDLAMAPSDPTMHAALMYNGGGTSASVRWGPKLLVSSGAVFGLGVDLLGRSLVITDGAPRFGSGNVSAQWFDKDGMALTGEFVLLGGFTAGASTWFETTALIGGGLLLRRMDGHSQAVALVVVDSGSDTVRRAPDWMVSRRNARLQIARGGQAYAVLPLGAKSVSCKQRVELIAPDGTSCGAADYPIAGGTCDTLDLRLGADGTIIQQLPTAMEAPNEIVGGHTCTWRWWPAALR